MAVLINQNVTGQTRPNGKNGSASDRSTAVRDLVDATTKKADQQKDVAARLELYQNACEQMLKVVPKRPRSESRILGNSQRLP